MCPGAVWPSVQEIEYMSLQVDMGNDKSLPQQRNLCRYRQNL